jgi:serine/threonine protein kinase
MPDVRTPCPSAQQLSDFGLGKLSPGDVSVIHEHLTNCPQCRQKVAEQPPDSFVGQLRAAAPQGSNTVLPRRSLVATTLDDVPPELAASSKFEVLGTIGEGGMGAVYKAKHRFLGELVAIKVMNAVSLSNPEARGRFLREMQAAGQLKHKNIVRALDAEEIGNLLVLVMEYVEGITLDRLVAQKGTLPVGYSCHCIVMAALGLQYAHEKSMVHRDVKPGNLILATKERDLKLLDFGLARGTRGQKAKDNHTQVGVPMGTPAYMAPEQVTDASGVDIRADIYSLGCTLYYLLAGQSPFQRDSAMTTMMAQVSDEPRPLPEVRSDVCADLWAVMAKMLAKKPEDRYQTPKEVEQALRPFLAAGAKAGQGESRRPPGMADAATLLPSNTSQLKSQLSSSRLRPAAAVAKEQDSSAFTLPASASPVRGGRKAKGRKVPPSRKYFWAASIAAGVLATALLSAVVLTLRTPGGGKVVVEIEQADAEVFVDGQKQISIRVPGEKERIEITLKDDKEHMLEVKKGGFVTETRRFSYRTNKGETIRVALRPEKSADRATARPPMDDKGFVRLFNGKDLKGWQVESGDPEQWKVEDGIIVGSHQGTQPWSALLSALDYANFVLRFEYRPIEANSFSWVVYHSAVGGDRERVNDQDFPLHPNLGLGRKNQWGIEPTGRLWWRFARSLPANKRVELKDPNEWNEVEVQIRNPEVRMFINGEEVSRTNLNDVTQIPNVQLGYKRPSGRIGFQALDGGAQFRNIRIKELPADVSPLGLGGSRLAKRFPVQFQSANSKWCVIGKHLVQPTTDPFVWIYFGDLEWTDYDFSVEAQKISGNNEFALFFRNRDLWKNAHAYSLGWMNTKNLLQEFADGKPYVTMNEPPPGGVLKGGEWYSARVEIRGNQVKCLLDGRRVFSFDAIRNRSGCVGLRTHQTAYVFRNIKVTSPDGKVLLEGLPDLGPPGRGK